MPEIPDEMRRNNRPRIPEFGPDEYLFRRVEPKYWEESGIEVDAIELPDMSVNRSSLGPPGWVRLEDERFSEWAVVGFRVADIPQAMLHNGTTNYTFEPKHVPLDHNYPHSEVRCFADGTYINAKRDLDPGLHMRWREKLSWKIRTFLRPGEDG